MYKVCIDFDYIFQDAYERNDSLLSTIILYHLGYEVLNILYPWNININIKLIIICFPILLFSSVIWNEITENTETLYKI